MATYMVNSLYVMKTTLALFEFTDKRLEMLEFQVCKLSFVSVNIALRKSSNPLDISTFLHTTNTNFLKLYATHLHKVAPNKCVKS